MSAKIRSDRIPTLRKCIQDILVPGLRAHGFDYHRSSHTFRKKIGECIQIIEIQIGRGSLAEKFTVNLAVYHPKQDSIAPQIVLDKPASAHCIANIRLGMLADTIKTRFFRPFFKSTESYLGYILTQAGDKWWRFSIFEPEVRRSLTDVNNLLEKKGLDWLDRAARQLNNRFAQSA